MRSAILERYAQATRASLRPAFAYLRQQQPAQDALPTPPACQVTNLVIGNNAVAVDAAGIEAERRGYSHAMHAATSLEGPAEDVGLHLAQMAAAHAVASPAPTASSPAASPPSSSPRPNSAAKAAATSNSSWRP